MNDSQLTPISLSRPASGPDWVWEFVLLLEDLTPAGGIAGCPAAVLRPDAAGVMRPTAVVINVYTAVVDDDSNHSTVIPAGGIVKADWHKPTKKWWLSGAWRIGV